MDIEHVTLEQPGHDLIGLARHGEDPLVPVEAGMQERLQFPMPPQHVTAHAEQRPPRLTDSVDIGRLHLFQRGARRFHEIGDDRVDHRAHGFVDHPAARDFSIAPRGSSGNLIVVDAEQFRRAQFVFGQQPGAETVVDVVIVIGDLVGDVCELRLESWLQALEEPNAHIAESTRVAFRAMLQDSLAGFERQVQPGEIRILFFELVGNSQRLQVVLKSAIGLHAAIQRILTRVPEGRMTEIMREADCLDQLLIQTEAARDGSTDLCDLERVCQPRAVMIALVVDEYLSLVHEATKRGAVDDPVPIALILAAIRMGRLRIAPAAAVPLAGRARPQPRVGIDRHAGQ